MVRNRNIITIVAAAAFAAAPAAGAFARGGHGMGGMGMGMASHASIAPSGPIGGPVAHMAAFSHVGPVGMSAGTRPWAWSGNHIAMGHHFPFHHHRFHNRFFFVGAPYLSAYYDDGCYTRVWTRWGWRWTDVCTDY